MLLSGEDKRIMIQALGLLSASPTDAALAQELSDRIALAIKPMTEDENWYFDKAMEIEDNELEVDEHAQVSAGDDDGAWIQTWLWIEEGPLSSYRACEDCYDRVNDYSVDPITGDVLCPTCEATRKAVPGRYQALVQVQRQVPITALMDPEDRAADPSGTYDIFVQVSEGQDPETRILDAFHQTIPIGGLEDFEITVTKLQRQP